MLIKENDYKTSLIFIWTFFKFFVNEGIFFFYSIKINWFYFSLLNLKTLFNQNRLKTKKNKDSNCLFAKCNNIFVNLNCFKMRKILQIFKNARFFPPKTFDDFYVFESLCFWFFENKNPYNFLLPSLYKHLYVQISRVYQMKMFMSLYQSVCLPVKNNVYFVPAKREFFLFLS